MSGRGEERGGDGPRAWIRGALVVVAIAAVLGAFGLQNGLSRPALGALNVAGIAVMLAGLAMSLLSGPLSGRFEGDGRERAAVALRLGGVLVCGVGAIMVFM